MTTFAYWLCAVERDTSLPPSDVLASEMSVRYEIEDQVIDPNGFDEIQSIVPAPLLPIAPITLAHRWSPFPAAAKLLGDEVTAKWEENEHRAFGYVIWRPQWLGDAPTRAASRNEAHLRFLLGIAACKAEIMERDLFLFGQIGWSYKGEEDAPTNPEVALAMLQSGYVYTERVAR